MDAAFSRMCCQGDDEHMPLLERITRTHPIWYLPGISKLEAESLLLPHPPGVRITCSLSWNSVCYSKTQVISTN